MAVIEIQNLTKSYGKTRALNGLNISVNKGDIHGFIGMNGAGKSTTIRILMGLLRKDGGDVKLLGGDPFTDSVSLHKRIAYVQSEVNPWPNFSGGEVIDLLSRLRSKPNPKRRAELIERFQFDPAKKCRSYSKGNRQKVALIAALVSDVELYIFDEPTSGLDPLMESVFQDCARELAAEGRTVFLSSHILAEVEKLCTRVSIIKDGIIVETGSMSELTQFSRLIVKAECKKVVPEFEMQGVYEFNSDGNNVSFRVDASALNEAIKRLTEYETIHLRCEPPELGDLFLHHYKKGGDTQ
jgi:ABC-2 type transport system ATP-binding protein